MGRHNQVYSLIALTWDEAGSFDHPLCRAAALIDFGAFRGEVAHCYGRNGNESVDPGGLIPSRVLTAD